MKVYYIKRKSIEACLILGYCLTAIIVILTSGCAAPTGKIDIPLEINNGSNVGSLQAEISYDASVLNVTEVKAIDLGKNAMIEANLDTPGYIIIGIVDSSGINGSGSVVSISFNVLEKDSASSLIIKNVTVHDVNTLVDLPTSLTQGNFASGDVSPPTISFK